MLGPPLAALPAIRRGVRIDLREALESTGSVVGGQGALDRALRRVSFLPRTMQLGLRGVGRRKRRSFATALIVALAVGNLLAVLALAAAATETTRTSWDDHLDDVRIWTAGSATFDRRAERAIRSTPGVATIQPALVTDVRARRRGRRRVGRAPAATVSLPRLRRALVQRRRGARTRPRARDRAQPRPGHGHAGRGPRDAVDGRRRCGVPRGRRRRQPAGGRHGAVRPAHHRARAAARARRDHLLGQDEHRPTTRSSTAPRPCSRIAWPRSATRSATQIKYVAKRDEIDANKTVTTSIAVLGFLVIAISMVGLANAMTMSVIERTREIGVLRCIGARARDVRRIFASEGGTLAVAGWLLGIPVGYALDRALVWLVKDVTNIDLPVLFPPGNVALALIGTVALALVITLLPIRRAVRFRPGDALRYG